MIGIGLSINSPPAHTAAGARLTSAASRIFGSANILTLTDIGDAVDGVLVTIPNRAGPVLVRKSTAGATATIVDGRRAAVFSAAGDVTVMAYVASSSARTNIVVARWDGGLPFSNYYGLLSNNDHISLAGYSGYDTWITSLTGMRYRDGVVSSAVDTAPHTYSATFGSAPANEQLLGNHANQTGLNWRGPVWHLCQLSIVATAQQLLDYQSVLKNHYPFLP